METGVTQRTEANNREGNSGSRSRARRCGGGEGKGRTGRIRGSARDVWNVLGTI